MLDYRMNTLLTVCKHMNFTKAARELHLAQSTVSLQIHSLEEFYGAKLFTFQGKKMQLTHAGRLVLDASITQQHDEQRLKRKIQLQDQAPIRLGATLSVAESMICQPLVTFLKNHPRDFIQITIDNTQELLVKINRGILDAAFVEGTYPTLEFDALPYGREPFVAVCSPAYPGCENWRTLGDLFSAPLLLREAGSGSRGILESFLAQRQHTLEDFNRVIEIGSIRLIKEVAQAGGGISFLYESVVREELKSGALIELSLDDCAFSHEIFYLWRKNSLYSKEYQEIFREFHRS